MRTNLTTLLFLFSSAFAVAQTCEWSGRFGGDGEDVVLAIHADATGNVYTTGYFTNTCDFDISDNSAALTTNEFFDCFVQKTAPDGTFLWAKKIGGLSGDNGTKVTTDADGNVYITGVYQETADFDPGANEFLMTSAGNLDIFLVKLTADGNFVWAKSFSGTEYEESNGLGTDSNGNIYLSGYFYNPLDFDPNSETFEMTPTGSGDGFVVKLNPAGEFVWAKKFGGENFDLATGMKVMPNGDVYVSGNFEITANFDVGGTNFTLTTDNAANGIFLLHLKNDGSLIKALRVGQCLNELYGYSVDVDSAGAAYIVGYFGGATVFTTPDGNITLNPTAFYSSYIAKVDAAGTVVWAKPLASDMLSITHSVAVNSMNEVLVHGYFNGTLNLGGIQLTETTENDSQSYVAKLNSNGDYLWAQQLGSINFVDRSAIAVDGNNNTYLASAFETTADINPNPAQENIVSSAGFRDNFLAKLNTEALSAPDYSMSDGVTIYPNPAKELLNITAAVPFSGEAFIVYDMAGRQVLKGNVTNGQINISSLQTGIYNVMLDGYSHRIIKE